MNSTPSAHSPLRELLYHLVRRDLAVRYKSTVLGFLWSFIKPLALTGIFYVVFDLILGLELNEQKIPFALHLLSGMLAWTFFAGATGESLGVILGNANLIKKVRLPLVVFPLSAVCSQMIHFVLALLVLVALLIVGGLTPTPSIVLVVPIMAIQFILTLAVCLLLSSLNVFYRDIASIWEVLTQAWFYATPIIYPVYMATGKLQEMGLGWAKWLYLANPMTPVILAYRRVLLYAALEDGGREMSDPQLLGALGLCLAVSLGLLWFSLKIFVKFSQKFADEL